MKGELLMYDNGSSDRYSSTGRTPPQMISLREAQGVFAHRSPRTTRNYLQGRGVQFYSSPDSHQPLNGELKEMDPSQLWVNISSVEMVVQSYHIPLRKVTKSRLEEILAERKS
ncbi:hypothetical protein HYY73_05325 [Candidatus Woesearchaeota archaeon]|nr:hypothetical protein [Candidatus Woesearchaeota archaeon]